VSCYRNTTNHVCDWTHNSGQSIAIDYDLWLVNGNPYTKHFNPFEHQFSFELHDVVEIYLTFFIIYTILLPIQVYAFIKQKHVMTRLLTGCMICEYIGIIANFIHFFKFAFDGQGVEPLRIGGTFIDMISQCLLMLLLLLIAKGWTITRLVLSNKKIFLALWSIYTAIYMALFIWNLVSIVWSLQRCFMNSHWQWYAIILIAGPPDSPHLNLLLKPVKVSGKWWRQCSNDFIHHLSKVEKCKSQRFCVPVIFFMGNFLGLKTVSEANAPEKMHLAPDK
jgi:hypothetical protein